MKEKKIDIRDTALGRLNETHKRELMATVGKVSKEEHDALRMSRMNVNLKMREDVVFLSCN
jgi:CRISPR/Cas system-associated endoribonuclease Cas2